MWFMLCDEDNLQFSKEKKDPLLLDILYYNKSEVLFCFFVQAFSMFPYPLKEMKIGAEGNLTVC